MGVSPVTKYPETASWYEGNPGYNSAITQRVGLRWVIASRCTDVKSKTWVVEHRLQIKVKSGNAVSRVETGIDGYSFSLYATNRRTAEGTKSPTGFNPTDSWFDVYLEGTGSFTSNIYLSKGALFFKYTDNGKTTITQKNTDSTFYPTQVSNTISCYTPAYVYGGIKYTRVGSTTLSSSVSNVSSSGFTFTAIFNAEYDCAVDFRVTKPSTGQVVQRVLDSVEKSSALLQYSVTITNLNPYALYGYELIINCENGTSNSTSGTQQTLPIYVESISCANDLYVNENETITLIPTIYPSNASIKQLAYKTDGTGDFSISTTSGTQVQITGNKVDSNNYLDVTAQDSHQVTKRVNIHICKPAEVFSATTSDRRLVPEGTYQIAYNISPSGATDKTVTFTSADTSVATVSSSGLVTAQGEGTSVITLSLAKRVINEYGIVTGTEYLTSSITINVTNTPSYDSGVFPPAYINAEYVDAVFENFLALRNALNGYQYETGGTTVTISIPEFDVPQTQAGRATPIYQVKDCLNAIELAIDAIYDATKDIEDSDVEFANETYDESYTWEGLVPNPYEKCERWIYYMQDIYQFCVNQGLIE